MKAVDPSFDFNTYQRSALQSYGTGQGAVDYMLAQRYGAESFGALPVDFPERYGDRDAPRPSSEAPPPRPEVEVFPSVLELRYRGL